MRRIPLFLIATTLSVPHVGAQVVRDSAGIRVVTHPANAAAARQWRIEPKPILEFGGADGTGPTEFTRIHGVTRTADGGFVVANAGTNELRLFDAQGRHLKTMGRSGAGPGEFSQVRGVAVYRDTIHAIDENYGTRVFTPSGQLVRQMQVPLLTGRLHLIDPYGVLEDGSLVQEARTAENRADVEVVGTRIETSVIFRITPAGDSTKRIATFPSWEHHRAPGAPLGGFLVPFAPHLHVAVFPSRVCAGRPVRYEISCFTPDGAMSQIIRRDLAPVPVTDAARNAHAAAMRMPRGGGVEGGAPPTAYLEQLARYQRYADAFPAYDWLVAGRGGELWVRDFRVDHVLPRAARKEGADATDTWNVFAENGTWIGAVKLPARFWLAEAGRDYVLGVSRDEDDVERVTLYRLLR